MIVDVEVGIMPIFSTKREGKNDDGDDKAKHYRMPNDGSSLVGSKIFIGI